MRLTYTLVTLSLSLFILSACATTNQNPAQGTISSMDDVEEKLNEISEQLAQTESALQDVSNASQENIEDAFNSFSENIDEVEDLREDLSDLVEEMNAEKEEYLSHWQSEANTYDSESLRSGSEDRRQEVSDAFNKVMEYNGELSRTINSYLSAASEIESYLRNDMTTRGVEAVYSLTQQVEDTGEEARQAINDMQKALEDAQREVGAQDRE